MRYAVRKVRHRWAVCAGRLPLIQFDEFEEALHVARNAAITLSRARAVSVLGAECTRTRASDCSDSAAELPVTRMPAGWSADQSAL